MFVTACVLLPAMAGAQSKRVKAKARQHSNQGEMYMQAGVYDLAIKEYEVAYRLVPSAHGFLFNIALAYEKWDKKDKALATYQRFLRRAANHSKAAETKARMIALRRKIQMEKEAASRRRAEEAARRRAERDRATQEQAAKEAAAKEAAARQAAAKEQAAKDEAEAAKRSQMTKTVEQPGEEPEKEKKSGLSWGWVAVGTAVVLGGVFTDWGPPDARNGELNATDFVPVALYGVGGYFLYKGVF